VTREQADALATELRAASDAARELGERFPRGELAEAPSPGAWSADENLMHLTLTSQALIPRMTRTLGKLADAGKTTTAPARGDWVGSFYAWVLEPPARMKAKTPRPFSPGPGTRGEDALPAFLAEQEQLVALLDKAVGLDLAARKVPSPFSRYVQYNVYSAFRILLAHERRHLWQARRAAEAVRARSSRSATKVP
jgi:hypothetical protein